MRKQLGVAASGSSDAATKGYVDAGTLDRQPIGSVFVIRWDTDHWEDATGATITSRPSSRTDLVMQCITTGTTPPSFAINGVDMLLRIGA